jgi:hypothetical protein
MAGARQKLQAGGGLLGAFRFRQDAAAAGDHRIGAEHDGLRKGRGDCFRLRNRQAQRQRPGQLARPRLFIDASVHDPVGDKTNLLKQRAPTWRGRSEDQRRGWHTLSPRLVPIVSSRAHASIT